MMMMMRWTRLELIVQTTRSAMQYYAPLSTPYSVHCSAVSICAGQHSTALYYSRQCCLYTPAGLTYLAVMINYKVKH